MQAPSSRIALAIDEAGDWRLKRWNEALKMSGSCVDLGEGRDEARRVARRLGSAMADKLRD